jgi:sulfoxide reductase heme-binding subunit YedZ
MSTNAYPRIPMPVIKTVVWGLALWPVSRLVWVVISNTAGPNPVETIQRSTGWWALTLLCITLSVSPLRKWLRQPWMASLRRPLGLFMFFYACLHLMSWAGFDQRFVFDDMVRDVVKRPFITVGMAAFALLIPLAVTSPRAVARRIGGLRWRAIHRAVYAVAVLGVLHYWWMRTAKHNLEEPILFAAVVSVLLGVRLLPWLVRTVVQRWHGLPTAGSTREA